MKRILSLMICLILGAFGFTQINFGYLQTDSLKKDLSKAKHDSNRVLLMANIAEGYRWSNPDSAMLYGQQALSLARHIKFSRGESNALISISVVQRELGNLAKALDYALNALAIATEHHFDLEEISALIRVANVYSASKNFANALLYFRQSEKKAAAMHNEYYENVSKWLIASAYEQMNKLDSAQFYAQRATLGFKAAGGMAFPYVILGDIQMKQKNYSMALHNYWQGLQKAAKTRDYRTDANLKISLANFYKKQNQFDSAIYYAKAGLSVAQFLSYKNRIISSSGILAEMYELKNPAEALKYYKIFTAAKDSLYGAEKMQDLQALVMAEQEKQKAIEAEKLAYQNRARQYALAAGLIVFLFIMLMLYRNNRRKHKANQLLQQQKLEIQKTLADLKTTQTQLIQSEKMASLGELTAGIAHEIQNPLNFVNNFSEVNKELLAEMNEEIGKENYTEVKSIAKDISDNEEKINHHGKRADAIVKGMLQHSRSSSGIKEPTDINALADEYLRLAYHGLRAKDKTFNAEFKTDYDESIGKINIIPQDIGRVILNLITNAFYAVTEKKKQQQEGYEPTVSVSTKKVNGIVEIKVSDNGTGIPKKVQDKIFQPFFTTKPTGQGTGLGLSLAYDIVKAHGGELKVETKEGEGTEFIILLSI